MLDTQALRRRLAGLADHRAQGEPDSPGEKATIRRLASDLCLVMAKTFGEELDRVTLWDKIPASLAAACAETPGADVELFICRCLEGVHADPAQVIRFEPYTALLDTLMSYPDTLRAAFVDYIQRRPYVVLMHGKRRWEEHKATMPAPSHGAAPAREKEEAES